MFLVTLTQTLSIKFLSALSEKRPIPNDSSPVVMILTCEWSGGCSLKQSMETSPCFEPVRYY